MEECWIYKNNLKLNLNHKLLCVITLLIVNFIFINKWPVKGGAIYIENSELVQHFNGDYK